MARTDLFDPIQRQVIDKLAHADPGQQAHGRHAAVDDGRRHRGRSNGFASAASVLRTNVAMHEEARRLDIKLLTDVFADQGQALAALATQTRFGFMAMDDALKMARQWLTTGARALWFQTVGRERIALLRDFRFHGGQIGVPGLFEQIALLGREGFTFVGEAHSAVMRQFQRQRLNLDDAVFQGERQRGKR